MKNDVLVKSIFICIGAYASVLDGDVVLNTKQPHLQAQGSLLSAGVRGGFSAGGFKFMLSFGGDLGTGVEFMLSNEGFTFDASFLLQVRIDILKEHNDEYIER